MPETAPARRLLKVAWAGMFVFGLAMALLGAILPLVTARLRLDLTQAGSLFFAMNAAMLLAMLCAGPLMDRAGTRPALLAGALLTAAGLAGAGSVSGFTGLLAALAAVGAGGGVLNTSTNKLVADLYPDPQAKNAALNVLGVFFGVGALSIPLAIGRLIETAGLPAILGAAALLGLLPAAGALALSFPAPRQAARPSARATWRLAREPLALLFGALLFLQSGSEFILGGYTSTYLTREAGLDLRTASYLLSGYWAAMMLARALLSRLLLKAAGPTVVRGGALATAACVLLMVSVRSPAAAGAAVLATGACVAGIYPTVLGQAGARFAAASGTVFGLLFAMALVGGMTLPWAVGRLAEAYGLRAGLLIPALNSLGVFFLQSLIARRSRAPSAG